MEDSISKKDKINYLTQETHRFHEWLKKWLPEEHAKTVRIGDVEYFLTLSYYPNQKESLRIGMVVLRDEELFDHFTNHYKEIEEHIGMELKWRNSNNGKESLLYSFIEGFSIDCSFREQKEAALKLAGLMTKFREAFKEYEGFNKTSITNNSYDLFDE